MTVNIEKITVGMENYGFSVAHSMSLKQTIKHRFVDTDHLSVPKAIYP